MEELRAPIVDRLVIRLINKGQIAAGDLVEDEGGAWRMTDAGRKTFLTAYQKAKQEALHHRFLDESTTWALVPHLQARLLARRLRADLDAYPPFEVHG
ncbi:CRISPR-associated endonuclease Cas1 [compost metagenome]